jgi:hypothetical protein
VYAGSTLLLAEDESTSIIKWRTCWSAIKPVRITFSHIVCSSPERLNLGFLLREKTCCCAHHTFRLEFPNCLAIIINYTPDIIGHLYQHRTIRHLPILKEKGVNPSYMAIKKALYGRQPGSFYFFGFVFVAFEREYFLCFVLVSLI